jgi:ABC-type transporter Mla subunit MlaD
MPRNKAHEVKVGIFVAAGLAIFAVFVVVLTGIAVTTGEDVYRVRFRNVAGLENGSIVALGGLKVGRVESVGIAKDNPAMMEAVIQVKNGTPIRANSKAEVTSVGLTGSMYLSLTLGTSDAPLLKPGATIRGAEAASFQEVINEARQAAGKVNQILGGLGETMDSVAKDAQGLMGEIRGQASKVIATTDRVLTRAESILSARNEQNINRFLAAVSRVSDSLEKNIEPLTKEFNETLRMARGSLREVNRTADAYAKLADQTSVLVTDVQKRVEPLGDLLQKETSATGEALRKEIREVGEQVRRTVQEGGKDFTTAVGAVEGVSQKVQEFFETNRRELRTIVVNMSEVAERLNKVLAEVAGDEKNGDRLVGAAEELRLALGRARSLLTHLDETVASHREDIEVLITDLRETATNLNELTTTLRERPFYIFRPPASPREFQE